ncbi:MAG TPA: hypothetical protein VIH93_05410 [Thermoanaerobaculia bacterium]|jgi:hypothetical protein
MEIVALVILIFSFAAQLKLFSINKTLERIQALLDSSSRQDAILASLRRIEELLEHTSRAAPGA